jgi:hypothetical protein
MKNRQLILVADGSARWRDESKAPKPAFYCLDSLLAETQ